MSAGTVNGATATRMHTHTPARGLWYVDAEVPGTELAEGAAAAIVLGDLQLSGTVVSGGTWQGQSRYRFVAGAGGWGRDVPEKDYVNDAGVTPLTVIREAAHDAGEAFDLSTCPAAVLGRRWLREAAPAARVLELVSPAWYVGEDGVGRCGARPRTELGSAVTTTRVDRDSGVVELHGAASLAALVPGVVVEDLEALDVVHELEPTGIRSILYCRRQGRNAWRALIEAALPDYRFRGGPYEYRVVSRTGARLNLQTMRTSLGLPNLRRVRVRPGLPGMASTPKLGAAVLVSFVNADPSGAVVTGFEDADGPGFLPDSLSLCPVGGVALGVARTTDTVVAGPFGGTITGGSARVKAGA